MSLIVREAGGRFTDFSGNEKLAVEALSSNGLLHDRLLETFRR
jgi:fructose-1,6-bisphosphatase/inositol monophosphatase family enzyme